MANQTSTAIIESMIELSANVIAYCEKQQLPFSVIDQVTRAVTSIGANFTEAQDASSKKDFLNKIYIAKKEASETKYWLQIVEKMRGGSEELKMLIEQTQRFVMMLQKIVNTSRESNGQSPIANSSRKATR